MSVTVNYKFALAATETVTGITGASASTIDYSQFEKSGQLNATSTPPATKVAYLTIEGTGSDSGTLDLTALTGPLNSVIDATGLKLQMLRISSAADSVGIFTLAAGATNGYTIEQFAVGPGETAMKFFNDHLDDVASGDKTLDWDSTDDVEIQLTLIFG